MTTQIEKKKRGKKMSAHAQQQQQHQSDDATRRTCARANETCMLLSFRLSVSTRRRPRSKTRGCIRTTLYIYGVYKK